MGLGTIPSEYLNIMNNNLCMTSFLKLNNSSSLIMSQFAKITNQEKVIVLEHLFGILIISSRCVS